MKNENCRTWIMARELKNIENEKQPGIWRETMKNVKIEKCSCLDLEYGKKTKKY